MASRRDSQPQPVGSADVDIVRRGGLRAIGVATSRLTVALADKRGWTAARLIADWPSIVGAELARNSLPERLLNQGSLAEPAAAWQGEEDSPATARDLGPRGSKRASRKTADAAEDLSPAADKKMKARPARRPAALRIRVGGAAALEIQHREPQIVERINGWFGYRAIDRLKLVQGPLPVRPSRPRPRPLDVVTTREIDRKVEAVRDEELRAALASLGRAIACDRTKAKG